MKRPAVGALVAIRETPVTTELGVAGLYGHIERVGRATVTVTVGGARYRLHHDEYQDTGHARQDAP